MMVAEVGEFGDWQLLVGRLCRCGDVVAGVADAGEFDDWFGGQADRLFRVE